MKITVQLIIAVGLYYLLGLSLGYATKYFLSPEGYNFNFPVFKTAVTNCIHSLCSALYLMFKKNKQPFNIEKKYLLFTILPASFLGSIDTGISVYILRYIDLAYYTIIKSSTPVFILLTGFFFKTEELNSFSFVSIISISIGIFMVTIKPSNTVNSNVYILIISSIISGLRWTFLQYILKKTNNQQISMFCIIRDICMPTSFFLFLYSMLLNTGMGAISSSVFFSSGTAIAKNTFLLIFLGFCSFVLISIEFYIVSITSVMFLSVSSIIKELIIVGISLIFKSNCMTNINYIGLAISICGLICYNILRFQKQQN